MKTTGLPLLDRKKALLLAGIVIVIALFMTINRKTAGTPPLTVVSTIPDKNGSHNPFQPITIAFNRVPRESEYTVSFNPPVEFQLSPAGSPTVQLTPKTNFEERTRYTMTVSTVPSYILTFETEQIASNVPGWNEQYDNALEAYDKKYGLQNRALTNIRKNSPVKQDGFVLRYSYDDNYYTVTLLPPYQQNKEAFFRWFTSLGVTDLSLVPLKFINQ